MVSDPLIVNPVLEVFRIVLEMGEDISLTEPIREDDRLPESPGFVKGGAGIRNYHIGIEEFLKGDILTMMKAQSGSRMEGKMLIIAIGDLTDEIHTPRITAPPPMLSTIGMGGGPNDIGLLPLLTKVMPIEDRIEFGVTHHPDLTQVSTLLDPIPPGRAGDKGMPE